MKLKEWSALLKAMDTKRTKGTGKDPYSEYTSKRLEELSRLAMVDELPADDALAAKKRMN